MDEILTSLGRLGRNVRVGSFVTGSSAACGWLCAVAMGCGETPPRDTDRLSSLSTGQLGALCDELPRAWENDAPLLECENGRTLFLDEEGIAACGSRTTTCSATVAEWRACMGSLFGAACAAAEQEPPECLALRSAPGCSGLALPVQSVCTPPTADFVGAFDGVYEIVETTRNDTGCEGDGALQPGQGFIALGASRYPGFNDRTPLHDTPMLILHPCQNIDDCRSELALVLGSVEPYVASAPRELPSFGLPALPDDFVCGPDDSGALSTTLDRFTSGDGCAIESLETALRLEPEGFIRLTLERFEVSLPPDGEQCSFDPARETSRRCLSTQVLRASRVSEL